MHGLIRLARTPLTAPGGKAAAASITSCLAAHDIHTPSAGYTPATTEPWCDAAEQGVRTLQKTLHGKQREKDRYRYDPANKHSIIKRLEKARASCSDSATFWATARHKSKFSAPQQSLVLPRPGYETKVVTEPAEFLEVERDHITKHMAGTANPWTMSPDNQQHPIAPLNSAGRRYRCRLAKHGAGASDVPVQFRGIFKHAKRLPMPAADRQAAELIFTTPIPFARFEAYTAKSALTTSALRRKVHAKTYAACLASHTQQGWCTPAGMLNSSTGFPKKKATLTSTNEGQLPCLK